MYKLQKNSSLLIFAGNPTQYHAPLFKKLANTENLNIEILYGEKLGFEPFYSDEFKAEINWGSKILDGYKYKFFKNYNKSGRRGFFSRNNPGLFKYIYFNNAEYIIIHGYDTISSWYCYFASLLSNKKIIWRGEVIERKTEDITLKSKIIFNLKKHILPLYFSRCYKILYSCKPNKSFLSKYVIHKDKLISFPCAVDNDFFKTYKITEIKKINSHKKSLSIPDSSIVITTCSRLTKRKRTSNIIESIAASKYYEKIIFLIIGDGPEKNYLSKLSKNLGVNSIFLGFCDQETIAKIHSLSNVFVLFSIYDASPKALNEALNFEQSIIVSDGIGTSNDLVKNEKNGYIVKNPLELTEKINYLCKDLNKTKNMGKYNSKILKKYCYDTDIQNLITILN